MSAPPRPLPTTDTQTAPAARKDFIPELDGLRAIAVGLVLWSHLRPSVQPEWLLKLGEFLLPHYFGVDLFFVLSGFLITRILLVDRALGVPLRWFYARRCLRIFPIYYLLLLILAPLRFDAAWPWAALYLSNFYIFWTDNFGLLDHTWSLCVEEHFYLLWPPLVALLAPQVSRRCLLFGFFPVALLVGVLLAIRYPEVESREFLIRITGTNSLARFGSLAAGALLAYSEGRWRQAPLRTTGLAVLLLLLAWPLTRGGFETLGGAHLWLQSGLDGDPLRLLPTFQLITFPLVSSAVLLLAIAWSGTRAPHCQVLRLPPLTFIGRISYGIYLYHYPLYFYLGLRNPSIPDPSLLRTVLGLLAIVAIAALSFHWIERPILSLGRRFRRAG